MRLRGTVRFLSPFKKHFLTLDYVHQMKCKICDKECVDMNFLRRHIAKSHKTTTEQYTLKYELDGKIPLCMCGCGQHTTWYKPTQKFNDFIHGHHAYGRKKSEEEKKAIGQTNSQNMTRYMAEHPEIAKARNQQMCAAHTPEIEARRLESTRRAYANLTTEQRQKFRDHAFRLLDAGLIGPQAPYKAEWVDNPFTNQQEYMHSSWETAFLQRCIKESFPVTKKHDIRIAYTDPNRIERVYIPDFVGLEQPILFEIKGHRDEVVDTKEKACLEWCEKNGFELVMIEKKVQ